MYQYLIHHRRLMKARQALEEGQNKNTKTKFTNGVVLLFEEFWCHCHFGIDIKGIQRTHCRMCGNHPTPSWITMPFF